jgi:hypothetical protein
MTKDMALSLIEELVNSQQSLLEELNSISLQIEFADTIQVSKLEDSQVSH